MSLLILHHVSIIASDLERSLGFYRDLLGLEQVERPPIPVPGAWLACGDRQIHIIVYPGGTFRKNARIEIADTHFAFRTSDFDSVLARLAANGFREDAAQDDPKHLLVVRNSVTGFQQLYLLDPDQNIVEINAAP